MASGTFLFLCGSLAFQSLLLAEASLVAVYSLQRHGARNILPKGIFLTEDALVGGPTLLPEGQQQTYTAGTVFRSRYLNSTTCAATATCLPGLGNGTKYGLYNQPGMGFGNFDVYVRSSALDRAIVSGLCFFSGIFPPDPSAANTSWYMPSGAQIVPIYTQADADDILIRAYTKCPTYRINLLTWFSSAEFKKKSADSEALRAQVKALMPGTDTSLENWWNVYDSINVYRTYGVGTPVPSVNATLFKEIQSLAYWLETSKMRSNLTGNLLGGVALADLVNFFRLAATAATNGSQTYYKLVSLSGHYNTQLGLLAALELDKHPAASDFTWFSNIPKLAAVMVFELHAVDAAAVTLPAGSDALYFVRLVYQDGPTAPYDTVPLPCATAAAAAAVSAGACTLADFLSYSSARAINSSAAWCALCDNLNLGACAAVQLQVLKDAVTRASGGGSGGTEPWKIAVSVVVTFVGTVALAAAGAWLWHRRQKDRQQGATAGGDQGPWKPHAELTRYTDAPGNVI